jgi:hypothetical protein
MVPMGAPKRIELSMNRALRTTPSDSLSPRRRSGERGYCPEGLTTTIINELGFGAGRRWPSESGANSAVGKYNV